MYGGNKECMHNLMTRIGWVLSGIPFFAKFCWNLPSGSRRFSEFIDVFSLFRNNHPLIGKGHGPSFEQT